MGGQRERNEFLPPPFSDRCPFPTPNQVAQSAVLALRLLCGIIVVGILLDAEFIGEKAENVTRAVQHTKDLDAVRKRPVENEMIRVTGDRKEPQTGSCGS